MPTVECRDCKSIVSTSAEVCPHCGAKYPASSIPSTVTVHRIPALFGLASRMKIMMDDKMVGELKNDEGFTLDLAYGDHIMKVKATIPGAFSDQFSIHILPAKIYRIDLSLSMGWPKFKVNFQSHVSDI